MSNIVFYHSVPNNIPGILHRSIKGKWEPLFPERSIPGWLIQLFNTSSNSNSNSDITITEEIKQLLLHIKRGVRNKTSLALRMDCDNKLIKELLQKVIHVGFITEKHFLTEAGLKFLYKNNIIDTININKFDYSLYIPNSWYNDRSST